MEITELLVQFGLQNKEDEVYLACLQLGTAPAQEIAKKAGIKRTTTYDVLENLIQKGLITQSQKESKKLFIAEPPEKLANLLEEKKNKLLEALPLLNSFYNTAGTKPKISFYEGKEGLKQVYWKTLNITDDMFAIVPSDVFHFLGEDFTKEYINKRSKAKINAQVLAPNTKEMIAFQKEDNKFSRETTLVSQDQFPFSIEINICGNNLALLSFKENMGVFIESTEIARNMKFLFKLAWKGVEDKKEKKNDDLDYWAKS